MTTTIGYELVCPKGCLPLHEISKKWFHGISIQKVYQYLLAKHHPGIKVSRTIPGNWGHKFVFLEHGLEELAHEFLDESVFVKRRLSGVEVFQHSCVGRFEVLPVNPTQIFLNQ